MPSPFEPPARTWPRKFLDAVQGMLAAFRAECSFYVHLPAAAGVALAATVLQVSRLEACLLVLCVALVLGAELFNTALERLARAATREYSEDVRAGLNIASGAVLCMAIAAALVGLVILVPHAWRLLGGS